ncbi:N-acetylmuramoyl-L-alanine amidase [Terribacillus saccharophilus]|uniref:N-acetylmuramoyl-L-alanine amidase n=1 Tax=Terribacillus saccharophilus TaxID=361277 RepID=UPI003826FCBC
MGTTLCIAGHGKLRNGGFDPGATGIISKGEHRYMVEDIFPAMKRHLPKGADVVFFSDYKVLDYGNIVALANKYGNDTAVIEFHYDAATSAASGGHVIVNKDFEPDSLDLRLRDAIAANVGVRYSHKGHKGISGRDNLGNVNRSARGGVNYRLIELGFGTNRKDADVLLKETDKYAKSLVEAILNKEVTHQPAPDTKTASATTSKKSNDQIAKEVIAGEWGNGTDRESRLRKAGYNPDTIQSTVNSILTGKSKPAATPAKKSVSAIAQEVIDGKWGNGNDRANKLKKAGYNADTVQTEVNRILGGGSAKKNSSKSIDQMAKEVIAGKHGSGHDNRRKSLGISASEYAKVRSRVNQLL